MGVRGIVQRIILQVVFKQNNDPCKTKSVIEMVAIVTSCCNNCAQKCFFIENMEKGYVLGAQRSSATVYALQRIMCMGESCLKMAA